MLMKKYEVTLHRTVIQETTTPVEAEDEDEAAEKALKKAISDGFWDLSEEVGEPEVEVWECVEDDEEEEV